MREISSQQITSAVQSLVQACTRLTPSCLKALQAARQAESCAEARFALDVILQNAQIAQDKCLPVCQDTGVAVFFVDIGQDVHVQGDLLEDAINEGVRRGYKQFSCRASVLDSITRQNTADNTPAVVHVKICKGEQIKIWFLPKGFGSENMSRLYMLTPSKGIEGVLDCIVQTAKLAGSNPCPPIVLGVGIGGTSESAMCLAKRQLLREIGTPSEDETLAELEREALLRVNALHIGAQGFGGDTSALAVHIAKAPTHISALPVAVNVQCNAVRCMSVTI